MIFFSITLAITSGVASTKSGMYSQIVNQSCLELSLSKISVTKALHSLTLFEQNPDVLSSSPNSTIFVIDNIKPFLKRLENLGRLSYKEAKGCFSSGNSYTGSFAEKTIFIHSLYLLKLSPVMNCNKMSHNSFTDIHANELSKLKIGALSPTVKFCIDSIYSSKLFPDNNSIASLSPL